MDRGGFVKGGLDHPGREDENAQAPFGAAIPAVAGDPSGYAHPVRFGPLCVPIGQDARKDAQLEHAQRLLAPKDRTSVVSGKHVAVRVDLGGRRSLTNTIKTKTDRKEK